MEKAILKTLIYADIFKYPLKAYEIHKWLIGKQVTLQRLEKALKRLEEQGKVRSKKGYFFLNQRERLVAKRLSREKQSRIFFWKAKHIIWFLKFVPWIKLIGISGGLSMDNAEEGDDIDLFVITSKNRLWLSRILMISYLNSMGVRRKAKMRSSQVTGKLCVNILLEEDRLSQNKKDIYVAHEVLQMKVLWQKDRIYQKYLEDNEWVFKFLPNWVTDISQKSKRKSQNYKSNFFDLLEKLAQWFQRKVMSKPQGMERIEDGALYFHPEDCRSKVLSEYRQKLKKLSTS